MDQLPSAATPSRAGLPRRCSKTPRIASCQTRHSGVLLLVALSEQRSFAGQGASASADQTVKRPESRDDLSTPQRCVISSKSAPQVRVVLSLSQQTIDYSLVGRTCSRHHVRLQSWWRRKNRATNLEPFSTAKASTTLSVQSALAESPLWLKFGLQATPRHSLGSCRAGTGARARIAPRSPSLAKSQGLKTWGLVRFGPSGTPSRPPTQAVSGSAGPAQQALHLSPGAAGAPAQKATQVAATIATSAKPTASTWPPWRPAESLPRKPNLVPKAQLAGVAMSQATRPGGAMQQPAEAQPLRPSSELHLPEGAAASRRRHPQLRHSG